MPLALDAASLDLGHLYAFLSPVALAVALAICGALSLAHYRALPEVTARGAEGMDAPPGG